MTRHAFIPTILITDKGSIFSSNVIHELSEVLGITLRHPTTKHAQTILNLGKTHAIIMTSLKISTKEFRKEWQKCLPLAFLTNNTTYHKRFVCEHSRIIHGGNSYNIPDHKLGLTLETTFNPTTEFGDGLLGRTEVL